MLGWQAVLVRCRYEPRFIPILLAILRICICFLPQTGYIHPDEFFQSPDRVASHYFKSKTQPVWEFETDRPIRCMLIPNLLNQLAFKVVTLLQTKPSAYLLLVAPRLVYTLLSFLVDLCLYKLCQYYSSRGLWYLPVSVIFQSSFVCLCCLTRTLSNTPEVVIFSLLLVVVCQTIRPRFRILFVTPNRSRPANERVKGSTQLASSLLVGMIITIGTFNRPTFPCFALVPSAYWVLESLKRNSYGSRLTIQRVVVPLGLSAALTALAISAYDTVYYRDIQVIKDLSSRLLEFRFSKFYSELLTNWVVTPYNFVVYNTNVQNLSKYTLHLPYTHFLVNIPLAFNVLGLLFYRKLASSGIYRLLFTTHRIYSLMLLTTLISTILLSCIPHQEFRFLLPLIVPLVYAFGFNIYTSNKLLSIWLLVNIILTYFYSNVHQAGTISATLDLDPILKSYENRDRSELIIVNVISLRCYIVPSYQWNIEDDDNRFNFYLQETFDEFNSSVSLKFGRVLAKQREYPLYSHELYVMLPQLYERELVDYLHRNFLFNPSRLKALKHYAPHFSGEELQKSIAHIREFGLKGWREAFGFSLIKVDLETSDY